MVNINFNIKRWQLYVIVLMSIYSCNRLDDLDGFDNKEVKYHKSGKTKSIVYWNNLDNRKRQLEISEQGDTTEYYERYTYHMEKIHYYDDSTVHNYYIKDGNGDYWLNEWICYDSNGIILPSSSEYIYIKDKSNYIFVTAITDCFNDLNLILFDRNDKSMTKRDTIFFNQKKQLLISKDTLNNKKLLFVLRRKIDVDIENDSYSIIPRRIFVNLPIKLEYQKRIKINPSDLLVGE